MRADDEAEFCGYVAARRRSLIRTAYLLTGDWHTAEDLVQASLAKLYVAWQKVTRRHEVHAYVRKILLNGYIDHNRRQWWREQASAAVPDVVGPQDPADGNDPALRAQLLAALADIPPRQRAVLVLRFWEDLSVEQVADLMNCSSGTVKSQTSRALDRLREHLPPAFKSTYGERQ